VRRPVGPILADGVDAISVHDGAPADEPSVIRRLRAELALDCRVEMAENPAWEIEGRRLRFLEPVEGIVHWWTPATGERESLRIGRATGAAGRRASGGLVIALDGGFALVDEDGAEPRLVAPVPEPEPGSNMLLNDGKADRTGRFWAGSMSTDFREGAGSLYRLDADGSLHVVLPSVTISNGLGWSPDDRLFYYVDSPTHRIDCFDYDAETGTIDRRRTLVTIEAGGLPDGLTVDAEGCVWVAVWGTGCLHRYTSEGVLDTIVELPTRHVTSSAFGGPGLDELYVTTGFPGRDLPKEDPHVGSIFVVTPGCAGLPESDYAG
jgi:sugar lactone lactonase YvrE